MSDPGVANPKGSQADRSPFPFLVGRGRSGTTLLRAMFDSHPELAIPHESHFVVTMGMKRKAYERPAGFDAGRFVDDLSSTGFARWGLDATAVKRRLADEGTRSYQSAVRGVFSHYALDRGKPRYADKTPIYVLHIDYLAELFPEAQFIHIIRDGRDVALSYMDVDFGPAGLEEAAIHWKRFVNAGRRAGAHLGESRYAEVRYEALMADPEREVRRLCSFVDLDFQDTMLNYFERAQDIVGSDECHRNLYSPPGRALRDWRSAMTPRQVAHFDALAGDTLEELGYERPYRPAALTDRLRAQGHWMAVQSRRAARRALKLRAAR